MTGRSRLLTAILAVLIVVISVAATGCATGPDALTRLEDGRFKYSDGDSVWILDNRRSPEQILLNDKLYAVLQNGLATITLPDGRSIDVVMDGNGEPQSIRAHWNTVLEHHDYAQMNMVFSVHKMAGNQNQTGSLGWVIFLLLVIIVGIVLFIYAGQLVNSWKLGGIFNGHDTAKSLLVFKTLGILLMVIGVIILLAVIF